MSENCKFFLKAFCSFIVLILISALVVQLLWNWLITDIFGLRGISYPESLGLIVMCRILFGSLHKGNWNNGERECPPWSKENKGKLLTEEQRLALRNKLKNGWCQQAESESEEIAKNM